MDAAPQKRVRDIPSYVKELIIKAFSPTVSEISHVHNGWSRKRK